MGSDDLSAIAFDEEGRGEGCVFSYVDKKQGKAVTGMSHIHHV